jgi:hypothetical protein
MSRLSDGRSLAAGSVDLEVNDVPAASDLERARGYVVSDVEVVGERP